MDAIATPAKQIDNDQDDAKLAAKIKDAMKAVDAATATRNEKWFAAGMLLIEAQQRHPTEKAFANFLQLAGGIQIRRAHDLIAFAQGRKDFERHRIENAAAQQRHRDKLKAEKIERERRKRRRCQSQIQSQSQSPTESPKAKASRNRSPLHYVMQPTTTRLMNRCARSWIRHTIASAC